MEQYETLFSRVYQDLKGRIVTGQLPAGSDFPSIQRLRQEYQIGFRTAKEVTVRLREDGYIASRDRKPPQVCWEGGMPPPLQCCPTGDICRNCMTPLRSSCRCCHPLPPRHVICVSCPVMNRRSWPCTGA